MGINPEFREQKIQYPRTGIVNHNSLLKFERITNRWSSNIGFKHFEQINVLPGILIHL